MSSTATTVIANIRALLNDQLGSRFQRTNEQMLAIITSNMQSISADLYDGLAKQTTAATLVAGTDSYTLAPSATAVLAQVVSVMRHSDNWPLIKIPIAAMLEFKRNVGTSTGLPTYYTLYEDDSSVVKILLHPTPGAVDTLDAWYSDVPATLALGSDTVPFGLLGLRALEKMCAADVLMGMTPEERQKCGLTPDIIGLWKDDARRLLAHDRARTAAISRSGGVLRVYR